MAIQTTSLRDVFKQKAIDSVASTVWRDPETLEFKTDNTSEIIIGVIPDGEEEYWIHDQYDDDPTVLIIPANTLYAVGPRVKEISGVFQSPFNYKNEGVEPPTEWSIFDDFKLDQLYASAKSLTKINSTLCAPYHLINVSIPPNVFKNYLPNLTEASCIFTACKAIQFLPEDLFSGTPKLENIKFAFMGCSNLEEIPDDLFTGITNLKETKYCFSGCPKLKKIPDILN